MNPTELESLIGRISPQGPRYTSYPTADRFAEDFTAAQYRQALERRAAQGASAPPLSLYVHIPFCESVCYYCACNKIITRHHERSLPYLDTLEREIHLHREVLGGPSQPASKVSELHLGGGSPTFLDDDQLQQLLSRLRGAFDIVPGAETSIEVDPRTASRQRIQRWAAMGFNRISFGVQDFDPAVQEAVHRRQSYESVREMILATRDAGFESINVDLIHGLPKQTGVSFARTVDHVIALRPDRIALYGYAHLPQRFKPQRRIHAEDLPEPAQRLRLLADAIESFTQAGYVYIGMDHFALPDDALAVAKQQGRLRRNFQGYTTQPDGDLVSLGVSAIGRIGDTYSQNAKTLEAYTSAIDQGRFPIERGWTLDADDLLRREIIMTLMCQGRLVFDEFDRRHGVAMRSLFAPELGQLDALSSQGIVQVDERGITVTELGWFVVRAVAMVFDRHLQASRAAAAAKAGGQPVDGPRFSRIM